MKSHTGALLEAALGTAIVTAISFALPGSRGLLDLHPHPLWIVVLAIAVRYGTPAAYAVGPLAAAGYLLALWLQPGASPDPLVARDLAEPFLFVVAGAIVGEIANAPRRRLAEATEAHQRSAATIADLGERLQTALAVKGELEKRLVAQPATVSTLYQAAKRLETLDSAALYPALLDIVAEYLEVDACALYVPEGDRLRLLEGWPRGAAGRPAFLSAREGLAAAALAERRVLTIRDLAEGAGADRALLAGPIKGDDAGVRGVIVIEELPFLRFTPTTIRLFELLLDWGATAFANALLYERTRGRVVEDAVSGIYLPAHTGRILEAEFRRARRYQLALAVATLRFEDAAPWPSGAADERWAAVGRVAQQYLRASDTVGRRAEGAAFLIILPMTEAAGAEVIADRFARALLDEWAGGQGRAPVSLGVAALAPDLADAGELLARADAARRHYAPGMAGEGAAAPSSVQAAD